MKVHEASLSSDLQGSILKPAEQTGWGVVVLAGSSGRVDVARATLFAGLGAVCIALRYFGGERQPPGICELPLEVFTRATDRLIEDDRLTRPAQGRRHDSTGPSIRLAAPEVVRGARPGI